MRNLKVFVPPCCGYKKGTMTIAFIHSFHDVLPMRSVFQTCQTAAASSRVWLLWKVPETSYLPLIIRNTLSLRHSGLLVYNVIFIVEPNRLGPERLGPKRLGAGSTWYHFASLIFFYCQCISHLKITREDAITNPSSLLLLLFLYLQFPTLPLVWIF